ncbi:hypothetical protein OXX80_007641 [Metschnikowia pulcherrima]
MSEYKSFKKADLAKVAAKLGLSVRSKDTKQSLLEKIEVFVKQAPEKAQELLAADHDMEVVTLADENEATEEEEDESGENSENDESAENDESGEDEDESADSDDEGDRDYNAPPPINLKEWLVDPAIAAYEAAHDRVLQATDKLGVTTAEYNAELRDSLSKTVSLNVLEAAAEVSHYLYHFVPLVPVKYNSSVHQVFRDNIPSLNHCTWSVPDVRAALNFTAASVLVNWLVYAVAVPLVVSYYVNFTRRTVMFEDDAIEEDLDGEDIVYKEIEDQEEVLIRTRRFDPFIFALTKVLVFYFIQKHDLPQLGEHVGILHSLKNLLFLQVGIYNTFLVNLGNFPLAIGVANVAVALYSQFEEH